MTHTSPTRTYHYFLTHHTRNISYPLTLYATDVTIYTCLHRKRERGNARYGRKNLYDTRTSGALSIGRRDDQAIHQAGETRSLSVWGHLSRDAKCVGSVSRNQKAQPETKIAGLNQLSNLSVATMLSICLQHLESTVSILLPCFSIPCKSAQCNPYRHRTGRSGRKSVDMTTTLTSILLASRTTGGAA